MSDTTFSAGTVIASSWLQDVNDMRYKSGTGKGADAVLTKYSGTGGTARTVQNKLAEIISVKDFGAVGDGSTDDTAAIQAAITNLASLGGGALYFPVGTYKVTTQINITSSVWVPFVFFGSGNSTISSTHNGVVFNDTSGGVRYENLQFSGPGKANTGAWAISSALGQGWVKGCKFSGYYYAIECSGSTSGLIERNRFALCHAGVNAVKTAPNFSNIISIRNNYFDFNDYGVYIDQAYGVDIVANAFESNSTGAYFSGVRQLAIRGANWFESQTSFAFQLVSSCTGYIDKSLHIVPAAGNTYTVDYTTCRIQDFLTNQLVAVQNSGTQSIPHNVETVLTWDTDIVNPAGMHSTVTLPQNITIKSGGYYSVKAQVQFASVVSPGAGAVALLRVKKSGTTVHEVVVPMSANINSGLALSFDLECANGDTLAVYAYQNQGVAVNVNGGAVSGFQVRLLTND